MNDLREFCVKEAATARKELERLGDKFPTSTNYAFDRGLNLGLSHAFDRGLNLGFAQAMERVIKELEAGDKATLPRDRFGDTLPSNPQLTPQKATGIEPAKSFQEWYAFYGGEEMGVNRKEAAIVWKAALNSQKATGEDRDKGCEGCEYERTLDSICLNCDRFARCDNYTPKEADNV